MAPVKTSLLAKTLLAMLAFLSACGPTQDPNLIKPAVTDSSLLLPRTTDDCSINGTLPVLWIEADKFLTLQGENAFRFYIDLNRDLTLSAWRKPYGNKPSVLTLKVGVLSNLNVSGGNYLGNLILTSQMRADIEREINQNGWKYVKFTPIMSSGTNEAGQITYYITLANSPLPLYSTLSTDSSFMMRDTSTVLPPGAYELNPSPPRNE